METGTAPSDGPEQQTPLPFHNGKPDLAVKCHGITKVFGTGNNPVRALRGVDLEVYAGQMTLLVGPSGCGKTTLISIVAGLLDPTDGAITVLGKDLRKMTGGRLVEFRGKN